VARQHPGTTRAEALKNEQRSSIKEIRTETVMIKKQVVKMLINGKTFEVEIEDLDTSPMEVTVNGKKYQVELEAEGTGAIPAVLPAEIAPPVVTAVPAAPVAPAPPSAGSAKELRSPMPGIVLDISVKPGDKISRGQQLCALEAMKMKNAIRSPRDGVVASIEVREGQKVSHNEVLVVFE
jgi:biotin carboxyl carrier protein